MIAPPPLLTRRGVLSFLAIATVTPAAGQDLPLIAWLSIYPLEQVDRYLQAFRSGLAAQGFIDGRNVRILARSTDGDRGERLARLVAEIVAMKPAVIATIATQGGAIYGVRELTSIPVVYGFSGDPITAGLTSTLARPGRNLTGVTFMAAELNAKRLELVREIAPTVGRVVLLGDPMHPGYQLEVLTSERTAQALGMHLEWVPTRSVAEVEQLLAAIDPAAPDALIFLPDSVMLESRKQVVDFALRHRIPTLLGWTEFAQAGGLLSYGPNLAESVQRVGYLTSRILQGAKPSDLPIERPENFELAINLKTARSIQLDVPTALLARAAEVIE